MANEVFYTTESPLRSPLTLARQMVSDLLRSRELAWRLMVRDISAQYRSSLLGFIWAFIPPVVMAFSFTLASEAQVFNPGQTELPYAAYVMLSTSLWQTFVESLNGPIQAVSTGKPMLTRVNFPREALILAKLGEVGFNFAIKLLLIITLFVIYQIPVGLTAFLAPISLIHLVLLGTAIGILLSPLGLLYQDVPRGISLVTGFWLFLTPVAYTVPTSGRLETLVRLNPVTPLLVTTRELATTGTLTQESGFWWISGLVWLVLIVAWITFRLSMPYVIERVSS